MSPPRAPYPRPPACVRHRELAEIANGAVVAVAGLVITRQRPGTASGVIFLTLEDETGVANVIVWPKTYERFRRAVIAGRLLRVTGNLQREGIVTHLVSLRIEDLSAWLDRLGDPADAPGLRRGAAIDGSTPRSDEAKRPIPAPGERQGPAQGRGRGAKTPPRPLHPRDQARLIFPSRDFH